MIWISRALDRRADRHIREYNQALREYRQDRIEWRFRQAQNRRLYLRTR